MKIGIDSYCYHRFFGEVYAQQRKPPKQMTLEDFIKRAKELKVDGVSLESCFIPRFDAAYLARSRACWTSTSSTASSPGATPTAWRAAGTQKAYDEMVKSHRLRGGHRRKGHARGGREPHVPLRAARPDDREAVADVLRGGEGRREEGHQAGRREPHRLQPRRDAPDHHERQLALLRDQLRHGQLHARARRPDQGHGEAGEATPSPRTSRTSRSRRAPSVDDWFFFSSHAGGRRRSWTTRSSRSC